VSVNDLNTKGYLLVHTTVRTFKVDNYILLELCQSVLEPRTLHFDAE
jgi:hypothetical protein